MEKNLKASWIIAHQSLCFVIYLTQKILSKNEMEKLNNWTKFLKAKVQETAMNGILME